MSLPHIDPELQPALEGYLSSGMRYDTESIQSIREGMAAFFSAAPLVRPASVLVEDVSIPRPDSDTGLPVAHLPSGGTVDGGARPVLDARWWDGHRLDRYG